MVVEPDRKVEMCPIGIHYLSPEIKEMYEKEAGVKTALSAGFDLLTVEDVCLSVNNPFVIARAGIICKIYPDFHIDVRPRSSTFKNWQVIMPNSPGLIDEDYCGPEDEWGMPLLYLGKSSITIPKGTRLCQVTASKTVRLRPMQYIPEGESRGGFGSTG